MDELISPKQAAAALGVSESSLKRWCDQGLLAAVRTAGGHRRLTLAEVTRFMRERHHQPVSPATLRLPAASEGAECSVPRGCELLVASLLDGDEQRCRRVVLDLYLARHSIATLCDDVIAAAFRVIGERWTCHEAEVYQERRGCEIALRLLFDLRQRLPERPAPGESADAAPLAIGGAVAGDHYALPTAMAELVLRDVGWRAVSLGAAIPIESLVRAIEENRPRLFWLSVSHLDDPAKFVAEFPKLYDAATAHGAALVVGGRALGPEIRQQLRYSAFCDTMRHLESFAQALHRP